MYATPCPDLCGVKNKNNHTKKNKTMKKAAIIIVIAGMVVLDLILSGMNVCPWCSSNSSFWRCDYQ